MAKYIHLSKRTGGSISSGGIVIFDEVVVQGSGINYNQTDGYFRFEPGEYHINWFVSQMTGLATNGSNFAFLPLPIPSPMTRAYGSNHVKISETTGAQIIRISSAQEADVNYVLVNVSNATAVLSDTTLAKAGITIHEISDGVTPAAQPRGHWFSQATRRGTVPAGEGVTFSEDGTARVKDDKGIVTGDGRKFSLNAIGLYLVNYEIAVEATGTEGDALFVTNVDSNPYHTARGPSPLGTVVGNFQIVVQSAPKAFEIIESNNDSVRYTEASIAITQITDYAPRSDSTSVNPDEEMEP